MERRRIVVMHKNPGAKLSPFHAGMSLKTIYVYCVKIISQILCCNAQITAGLFSTISKNYQGVIPAEHHFRWIFVQYH